MAIDLNDPSLYVNRELSWLRFNSRVLAQTSREDFPPLEKLKFIAIYGTNLDEFYMIRVAGLKSLYKAGILETGPDKMTPAQQLAAIREYIHNEKPFLETRYLEIIEELAKNDVYIISFFDLKDELKREVKEYFFEHIYPIIIPIAIDATHPFPHLNNLSFGIALTLKGKSGEIKHGLIRIPRILPRFIKVGNTYVPIESVVEHFIPELFPGFEKIAAAPFRITRNADLEIEEEEADDFLEMLEEGLRSRNRGSVVRLELKGSSEKSLVAFLKSHLHIEDDDIYYYKYIPLNLGSLWQIVGDKDLAHLLLPSYLPKILPPLDRENLYTAVEKEDILLYHPYESFEPVVKFIRDAVNDPNTLAIRMTLYRVGPKSPIVQALIEAAKDGKQVTVLVELKARFDEENNLRWAKQLEASGAHVVYGIPGLKVHAKIAQVIKREDGRLKSYVHLSTGNYNPATAKIYTDVSFFTFDNEINRDATKFFHFLTGFSTNIQLDKLYMSPNQIKQKLLKLIEEEAKYKKDGFIILKANSLVDQTIIKALYKASMAGCRVELIIRGISCIKPQIKGISENIRVSSIIGKYLEHARIYWFRHAKIKCYISSADLMPRNLDRRVELMTPIIDPNLSERLEQILTLQLRDNFLRWEEQENGEYIKVEPKEGEKVIDSQKLLELYVTKIYNRSRKRASEHIKKITKKLLRD